MTHPVPTLDVERVRKDFPVLSQEVGGRPVVFLDSAASAQKPNAVIDAVGMEAHGSVLQTALDLLREGVAVYIPIDCVASRPGREADFDAAIQMLEAAGAVITTAETLLLQASPAPRPACCKLRSGFLLGSRLTLRRD